MAPKFRGKSDDWLDDQKSLRQSGKKNRQGKGIDAQAEELDLAEGSATVVEVFHKQSRVRPDGSNQEFLCSYRRAQVYQKGDLRERSPVAVGDRVKIQILSPQSGVIEGRCKRANSLARPAPDRHEKSIHIIAANVQVVAVVTSVSEPDFSMGIVDRFFAAAFMEKIPAILIVNKTDLLEAEQGGHGTWRVYQDLGIPVFLVSSKKDTGIDELKAAVLGKTVVFCGHSGVGKSSLLANLIGKVVATTGTVNSYTGKGKHTTTSAVMFHTAGDSRWIDTPGVKEFGLSGVKPEDLAQAYPEFNGLACTQKSCFHFNEENCDAKTLARYPTYRRILESLLEE